MLFLPLLLALPGQIEVTPTKNFSQEQQIKAIVATVSVVNEADKTQGSGAIVRQNGPFVYVLTAAHIVGGAETVSVSLFSAKSYPKPERVVKRAEVVARAKNSDVALLRFEMREPVPGVVSLCPLKLVPEDQAFPVLLAGCEQGQPTCVEAAVQGKKQVRKPDVDTATLIWEVGKKPPKGRSGGPLIDRRGYLLGLCSGTSAQKGYYTHIDEIHACLQQNGFRWLSKEEDK